MFMRYFYPLLRALTQLPEGIIAILAQLVEHITRNDEVVGSIPTNGSKDIRNYLINKNGIA